MLMVKIVSDQTFKEEVLEYQGCVLVDFWAEWCGPCRQLTPIIEQLAQKLLPRVKFVKVNADDNQDTIAQYGVRGLPTLVLFKNGEKIDTRVGLASSSILEDWIIQKIGE